MKLKRKAKYVQLNVRCSCYIRNCLLEGELPTWEITHVYLIMVENFLPWEITHLFNNGGTIFSHGR
jgi:hypothetical protein